MSTVETPSRRPGTHPCRAAGHRAWPLHHVPADPAGPGGPGGLQPAAGRAGMADVRHSGDAGPPGPVPGADLRLEPWPWPRCSGYARTPSPPSSPACCSTSCSGLRSRPWTSPAWRWPASLLPPRNTHWRGGAGTSSTRPPLGAFVTGLTGLNIATWWAATPAMLWLLVPGVLLVLYRTRKVLMASVFMVVVNVDHHGGTAPGRYGRRDGCSGRHWRSGRCCSSWASCSSEPLTLPPRRWQQLALAAVVGVVFAVPYNFGFIANSPEAALAAGQPAAFLLGQRGGVRLPLCRQPAS